MMLSKRFIRWPALQNRLGLVSVGFSMLAMVGVLALSPSGDLAKPVNAQVIPEEPPDPPPAALDTVEVPIPEDIEEFVKDTEWAIKLGKSFFWDVQSGSDGQTSCGSCHYHAGVDHRLKNVFAKGANTAGLEHFEVNADVDCDEFPFHEYMFPNLAVDAPIPADFTAPDGTVFPKGTPNDEFRENTDVVGSAGVVTKNYVGLKKGRAEELGDEVLNPVFNVGGCNIRQVTSRQAPNTIGAIFNQRNFWDGRANRFFNGVNPDGDMDPDAVVYCLNDEGGMDPTKILLDHASIASLATGPPRSDVEMCFKDRPFTALARKMLCLPGVLRRQQVDPTDSVLGDCASTSSKGLKKGITYPYLIKKAFHKKWWGSEELVDDQFTHMECNFTLFWGLAIDLYFTTLIADDTPFDRFLNGDKGALTESQKRGMDIFFGVGKCGNCHKAPTMTGAATHLVEGDPIEFMLMQHNGGMFEDGSPKPEGPAFYDNGFYNIGISDTDVDPGLSKFAFARRKQNGEDLDLGGQEVSIPKGARLAVDGAFKVPTLRNIELSGPYMHNGGFMTLEQVVEMYVRRGNEFENPQLDPDVNGIPELRGDGKAARQGRKDLVNFMKALTDERVAWEAAPFDHPEIKVREGHGECDPETGIALDIVKLIRQTGAKGGKRRLRSFADDCKRAQKLRSK